MVIRTRYIGPTSNKPARISAVMLGTNKRVIVSAHNKTHYGEPHVNAALTLLSKYSITLYDVNRFNTIELPDDDTRLHTNQRQEFFFAQ